MSCCLLLLLAPLTVVAVVVVVAAFGPVPPPAWRRRIAAAAAGAVALFVGGVLAVGAVGSRGAPDDGGAGGGGGVIVGLALLALLVAVGVLVPFVAIHGWRRRGPRSREERAFLAALLLAGAVGAVVASGHRSRPVAGEGPGAYAGRYHPWPGPLFQAYVGSGMDNPRGRWPARTLVLGGGLDDGVASWAVPCAPEGTRQWYASPPGEQVVVVGYAGGCAAPDTLTFRRPP